ncbi:hypothetical protein IscW_ISCW011995 [Ixodes scapularis]|uniref:Uncharacterized protein n=1 Tax=Ixodes scapularis TaxID=6945 RepID=B7QDX0_IXOSC|nr:hypothetical protein IscW_ISCW011995 [Ixodes scapularis]|eukprot:XP_002413734.1 hypothetical protein IscW_ISCW011995 [Ixodes scapularis]
MLKHPSNPEEEDLNESEYGGSGDDDDERRTPLEGDLSNDASDPQQDILSRSPLALNNSNHGSTPPSSNGSMPSLLDHRIPAPNVVVTSTAGLALQGAISLSSTPLRPLQPPGAPLLPAPMSLPLPLAVSQGPLFSLATPPPHMMHLPPTLTPHSTVSTQDLSKYASFEEQYGKHVSRF